MSLLLADEGERNGKNEELISQEQKNVNETKVFINNLIKQKEALVKQEI